MTGCVVPGRADGFAGAAVLAENTEAELAGLVGLAEVELRDICCDVWCLCI